MTPKKDEGVLSKSKRLARKEIDEETINNVISFYLDDEFSREMPGAKEYVSISYKQHQQKRLLTYYYATCQNSMLLFRRNFTILKLDFLNFVFFVQSGARRLVLLEAILYVFVPSIRELFLPAMH